MAPAELRELRRRIEDHHHWYHTIELGPGVTTPGWFDLRTILDKVPIPDDLSGKRCLDVATFDGFWAYTMESRGAAEVLAIDLLDDDSWDWPVIHDEATVADLAARKQRGAGFRITHEALGSTVDHRELSVYDLDPDDVGMFDFVYLGSLLLHLKDPVRALEAVRSICDGELVLLDAIHLPNTIRSPRQPMATFDGRGRPWWWKPNRAGLLRMVEAGGFEVVGSPQLVMLPPGPGQPRPRLKWTAKMILHPEGRTIAFRTWLGDPHLALAARPIR